MAFRRANRSGVRSICGWNRRASQERRASGRLLQCDLNRRHRKGAEAAMTPSGNGRTVHAAVYARVSTFDQDPENQLAELRRYVEARGDHGRASLPAAPRWKRSHATPSTFRTQHSSDGRKTASASGPIECVCRT